MINILIIDNKIKLHYFIKKGVKFTLILIIMLFLFGHSIYLKNIEKLYEGQINSKKECTTLIIGDSHAMCAFNPEYIDYSVNGALESELLFYSYYKIKYLHNDWKMRNIILSFSYHNISVNNNEEILFENEQLDRYYYIMEKKYFPINNLKESCKIFLAGMKYKCGIPLYGKNYANLFFFNKNRSPFIGFFHNNGNSNVNLHTTEQAILRHFGKEKLGLLSELSKESLYNIAEYCKQEDINLYIISTPLCQEYRERVPVNIKRTFYRIIGELIKNYDINYYDYSDYLLPRDYYGDADHLNSKGAKVISTMINDILISIEQ